MKKLLTVFSALALFAACKGKTADANTAAATTTTPATNTPAPAPAPAPAADPKKVFIDNATDCVCQFYTAIADLNTKLEAAPKKEKPAIAEEMKAMSEKQPECLATLAAEEEKISAGMSDADKKALEAELEAKMKEKCPEAAATIEKMSK